jgi:hypothetical protein
MATNAQRQWLLDRFQENSHVTEKKAPFLVAGHEVRRMAWCLVHGVSERRLDRVLKAVLLGQVTTDHDTIDTVQKTENITGQYMRASSLRLLITSAFK